MKCILIAILTMALAGPAMGGKPPPPSSGDNTNLNLNVAKGGHGGNAHARGGHGGAGGAGGAGGHGGEGGDSYSDAQGGSGGHGYGGLGGAGGNVSSSQDQSVEAGASSSAQNSNDGNYRSSNKTEVFSFATGFPQASECFVGAQGGGGGGGGGGFLGVHLLNKDCWATRMAEAEQVLIDKARLFCASKFNQKAIAHDVDRKDRRQACIDRKHEGYLAVLERQKLVLAQNNPSPEPVSADEMLEQEAEIEGIEQRTIQQQELLKAQQELIEQLRRETRRLKAAQAAEEAREAAERKKFQEIVQQRGYTDGK